MADSRRVVLATRNRHKLVELSRILAEAGLSVDLVDLEDFPDVPDVAETGTTFEENALLKARAAAAATGLPAVADDSGLCVDVLGGMPGVLSARWCGHHGDDAANLQLVLDQIAELPDTVRAARFVCAAALAMPDGRVELAEGVLEGTLARAPRGSNGFGYDPIFVPEGLGRTTAELSPAEKDAISHRGRAFRELAPAVARLLG